MQPDIPAPPGADIDFQPVSSDILTQIKTVLIELNEALAIAETANIFGTPTTITQFRVPHAQVFKNLTHLVRLTREVLPDDVVEDVETWFHTVDINTPAEEIFESASDLSHRIQMVLFDAGIKDINLVPPIDFPIDALFEMAEEAKQ